MMKGNQVRCPRLARDSSLADGPPCKGNPRSEVKDVGLMTSIAVVDRTTRLRV